ncbi:hypothetical protein KPH14_011429 [Odynerus spinipes]|uniref:Uncharacterized protein n=1 Tax=Odynerus spinipes TaxID=1348599 RepID=A0AAD9RW40_9HYME|nr:hypothetical protein KPH14_011429 [Odynerus spinipes]
MATEENTLLLRNLKDSAALLPRIAALRDVLRQLREELRHERENLTREINMAWWNDFEADTYRVDHRSGHSRYPLEVLHFRKGNGDNTASSTTFAAAADCGRRLLESKIYQSRVNQLQEELESFERSCRSTSMSSFYKRKIHDLERDCWDGLNKVREGFVESLQAFENTLDSIRYSEGSSRKMSDVKRCKEKKADGLRQRTKWQQSLNVEKYQPPSRTKSLIIDSSHHGFWLAHICSERFSDSAMCNAMYRASRYHLETPHIFGVFEPSNDSNFSTSFTTIFPIVRETSTVVAV